MRSEKDTPAYVSVIIPVYNDPHGICETLRSLEKQDYPLSRWEVIVVDNNSNDDTIVHAQSFSSRLPDLKVISEKRQSSYAARNAGIKIARGDIIAFIDSDITVAHNWITKGVEDIIEENADYVGCPVEVYATGNPPSIWEIYNQRIGFPVNRYMQEYGFAPTAGLFVGKNVFKDIGPFDPRLVSGGDYEFGTRVRDAALKMYYSENNRMRHPARKSLKSILKKTIRIARGYVDLRMIYPERFGKLTLYSLLIYFIIIPIKIPECFQDQTLRNKIKIFVLQLTTHYANISFRLVYFLRIKARRPSAEKQMNPSD